MEYSLPDKDTRLGGESLDQRQTRASGISVWRESRTNAQTDTSCAFYHNRGGAREDQIVSRRIGAIVKNDQIGEFVQIAQIVIDSCLLRIYYSVSS